MTTVTIYIAFGTDGNGENPDYELFTSYDEIIKQNCDFFTTLKDIQNYKCECLDSCVDECKEATYYKTRYNEILENGYYIEDNNGYDLTIRRHIFDV